MRKRENPFFNLCRQECKIMKKRGNIMKNLAIFTQFGISFIMPLLVCLFLCGWLKERFSLGNWIFFPGFFFGLGGCAAVAYKYYQAVMRQESKEEKSGKEESNRNRRRKR